MKLGEVIKFLRKHKGYKQVQFAKLTGISQTTLSQIETGVTLNPHKENINKICEVLGISYESLIVQTLTKESLKPEYQSHYWYQQLEHHQRQLLTILK